MLDLYPKVIPGPPRPSRILTASSALPATGRERYEVAGNGAILIRVGAGDRVTVVNTEGGQRAELVAADEKGRIDAAILGVAANSDAAGLKALLSAGPGWVRYGRIAAGAGAAGDRSGKGRGGGAFRGRDGLRGWKRPSPSPATACW